MIKLITGKKGTGKTKILIDKINDAVKSTNGDLICIEKGSKLQTFAGATHCDTNGPSKENPGRDFSEFGMMLEKLDKLTGEDTIVIFTVSADNAELPENVLKFAD